MEGLVRELRLGLLAGRDVVEVDEDAADVLVVDEVHDPGAQREADTAATVHDAHLDVEDRAGRARCEREGGPHRLLVLGHDHVEAVDPHVGAPSIPMSAVSCGASFMIRPDGSITMTASELLATRRS
ncbi:MAG: hypothetical protein M3527_02990 [Actinomycetota bacterium]|nr:hypothetical protein [Actinomycetota bacterium]